MGITFKDLEHLIKKKKEIGPKIPVAPYIEFPNGNFNTPQTNTRYTEKYSGLNNQGSTCYLNSLIQTLFMTPEFRLNILNWKYQEKLHGQKADCIPYQIKKLFSKLQLKNRKSEETKSLTKSFQWGNSDAFYQHDIQELCRVLFEAIEMSLNFDEEKFKSEKNFINDIFEGFSSSVVKCKECEYESLRKDKFLDISLPIRNEFEKIYNNSLEIALNNYTRIETLENDNKYFCEKCNKKTDALKFIKFEEMPSVLLFQLNRFEYDYMTGNRIKIKDKVTFPLVLDMNLFMSQKFNTVLNEEYFKERSESKINLDEIEFDKEVKKSFENGDYVYELYSIVIHSGTANGGHYYAYIKSFEDGNWYCFNDSEVTIINENDLENVFGGKGNGYTSSGSGYVLLYGKIKKDQKDKIKFISNEEIDEEMMKDIEKDLTNEKKEDELFKDKLMKITIKIYYDSNSHNIEFRKNDTIIQMKEKIIKKFNLEGAVIPSDFKLRIYSEYVDKKMEYVEDEEKVNNF
jgi:ubiquitin carboxyl-terminal hydrolase 47